MTNNPLHAFEFFKLPPIISGNPTTHTPPAGFTFQFQQNRNPAMPLDGAVDSHGFPTSFPTYDYQVNSMEHTDGLNDADEMNLYVPNPQADSPFGPADLEWLYRQQDVDGSSLVSPTGPARASELHEPDRRPAAAAALHNRFLGDEQLRLGERQPAATPFRTTTTSR